VAFNIYFDFWAVRIYCNDQEFPLTRDWQADPISGLTASILERGYVGVFAVLIPVSSLTIAIIARCWPPKCYLSSQDLLFVVYRFVIRSVTFTDGRVVSLLRWCVNSWGSLILNNIREDDDGRWYLKDWWGRDPHYVSIHLQGLKEATRNLNLD
jgi:hypothetical protein